MSGTKLLNLDCYYRTTLYLFSFSCATIPPTYDLFKENLLNLHAPTPYFCWIFNNCKYVMDLFEGIVSNNVVLHYMS